VDAPAIDRQPAFSCPRCRGTLTTLSLAYRCGRCSRDYPIVFGIPDFRLEPDPYISIEDEYRKTAILVEAAARLSFEALVRFYWEITPDVPLAAVERYVAYAVRAEERGAAYLEMLDARMPGRWAGEAGLEIGCGTGGFLRVAATRFRTVVGVDVALRWLVIARRRLQETGERIALVCGSATHLPFANGAFQAVAGFHVLEHTTAAQVVLAESARVLASGGSCFVVTPNRFSLGPEPCVRVWGVGFMPRALATVYVRLIAGVPYRNIRLLSAFELRRCFARAGFGTWRVDAAPIPNSDWHRVSPVGRALVRGYHALRTVRGVSLVLPAVAPMLEGMARK
jgi:ubiquinone/menaquinone biosynthesis C-methylase UbiE/uncharacterized protein YbaR (Trm112 family)